MQLNKLLLQVLLPYFVRCDDVDKNTYKPYHPTLLDPGFVEQVRDLVRTEVLNIIQQPLPNTGTNATGQPNQGD